jgi:hypothetical protein
VKNQNSYSQNGAASVEAALSILFFFILIFAFFDLSWALYSAVVNQYEVTTRLRQSMISKGKIKDLKETYKNNLKKRWLLVVTPTFQIQRLNTEGQWEDITDQNDQSLNQNDLILFNSTISHTVFTIDAFRTTAQALVRVEYNVNN